MLQKFSVLFRLIPRSTQKILNLFLIKHRFNFEAFYRQWSTSYLNMVNILKEITWNRTTHNNQSINQSISQSINQSINLWTLTYRSVGAFLASMLAPSSVHIHVDVIDNVKEFLHFCHFLVVFVCIVAIRVCLKFNVKNMETSPQTIT